MNYSLSFKQQRLVQLRLDHPELSNSKIILMAGYRPSCVTGGGQKVIKSTKVRQAIMAILEERAEKERQEGYREPAPRTQEEQRRAFGKQLVEDILKRA